jgi:hypothetical protein
MFANSPFLIKILFVVSYFSLYRYCEQQHKYIGGNVFIEPTYYVNYMPKFYNLFGKKTSKQAIRIDSGALEG